MKHQPLNFPVDFDKWAASLGTKKPHSASHARSACRQTLDVSRRLLPRALLRKLFPGHPGLVAAMDGDRGTIASVQFRRDPRPSFDGISRSSMRRALLQLADAISSEFGARRKYRAPLSSEIAGHTLAMIHYVWMDPYSRAVLSRKLEHDAPGASELFLGTRLDRLALPKAAREPRSSARPALNEATSGRLNKFHRKVFHDQHR